MQRLDDLTIFWLCKRFFDRCHFSWAFGTGNLHIIQSLVCCPQSNDIEIVLIDARRPDVCQASMSHSQNEDTTADIIILFRLRFMYDISKHFCDLKIVPKPRIHHRSNFRQPYRFDASQIEVAASWIVQEHVYSVGRNTNNGERPIKVSEIYRYNDALCILDTFLRMLYRCTTTEVIRWPKPRLSSRMW